MEQKTETVFLTKEAIEAEKWAFIKSAIRYLVGLSLLVFCCFQFIYKPFLAPAETWQKKSVVLCALKLTNIVEAEHIINKAFNSTRKYQFSSLHNHCSAVFEEDLQRRASDYTYRNLTDNRDRMVRELYYMGVYDKETLQAKTLQESEQDSPW